MVDSALYLYQNGAWRQKGVESAALKDAKQNHAERKLYGRYRANIVAAEAVAMVQDAAPCEVCHSFFLNASSARAILFVINANNKEHGGEGYPIPQDSLLYYTFFDGETERPSNLPPHSLTYVKYPDPPARLLYFQGRCHVGGCPDGFNKKIYDDADRQLCIYPKP